MANEVREFSSGLSIPAVGLGTWLSDPGKVTEAVYHALKIGYRHIDCAFIYQNEEEVGKGLKKAFDEGLCKREDVFITTKLWNTFHRKDLVQTGLEKSLALLGVDYIDLYLIHWPFAYKEDGELFPKDADGKMMFSNAPLLDTWHDMEGICSAGAISHGKSRFIGVSNCNIKQLEMLRNKALAIKPSCLQIECHPYLDQTALLEYCKANEMAIVAYSPLFSPGNSFHVDGAPLLLEQPIVQTLSKKYGRTPAQIVLRYILQQGFIVIPKSVTPTRIEENFGCSGFSLESADMDALKALSVENRRLCKMGDFNDHPDHPFPGN